MSWLGVVTGLFRPARELIEALQPDAEQAPLRGRAPRLALGPQELAALQQLAAELRARPERTWWDSLIDGLNRLPRPLITLGILAFFLLAPLAPVRFLEIAKAYQMMPDGFWALLSVIIAFYFGGRMQLKGRDMAVRGGALALAREILALRRAEAAPEPAPPPAEALPEQRPASPPAGAAEPGASKDLPAGAGAAPVNRVIEEWRRRQSANGAV